MQHIIKKQVIELDMDKRLDSFHMQESISRRFWNSVVPLLQKTFDGASEEGEVLSVDRLVIDMGVLTDRSVLKDDWIIELNSRLEKLIGELKVKSTHGERVLSTLPSGILRQWLFYMQKGYLPWNALKTGEEWYARVLEAMAGDPQLAGELISAMRKDPAVVKRIVAQHTDAFLLEALRILTGRDQGILKSVFVVIHDLPGKQPGDPGLGTESVRELRKSLWLKILKGHLEGMDVSGPFARSGVSEFLNSRNLPVAVLERLDRIIPGNTTAGAPSVKDQPVKEDKSSIQNSGNAGKEVLKEEGIFAVNAGIVLLHPFLGNLFSRLQIVKNNAFADRFQWQKALYLLHYLATGSAEAAEHELVIPKVLCAYPDEETVDQGILLSPDETGEADNMLNAVISQWEILKNTSIGGLREGFLQRSGKLFLKDDNLYLQVETSGIDILLDRLPWSLGIIRLPWMEGILRVEWR